MKYLTKLSRYFIAVFLMHFIFVIWFSGQIVTVYNNDAQQLPFYYKRPPPDLTRIYTQEEMHQLSIKSKKSFKNFVERQREKTGLDIWIENKKQAIYFSWYPYFLLFLLMQPSLLSVMFFTLSVAVLSVFGFFLPFEIVTISASILIAYLLKNIFNSYKKSNNSITTIKKIIFFLFFYITIKILIYYYIDIFHGSTKDRSLDTMQYSFTSENLDRRETFTTYLTNHAIEYEYGNGYSIIVNDRYSKDLRKVIRKIKSKR